MQKNLIIPLALFLCWLSGCGSAATEAAKSSTQKLSAITITTPIISKEITVENGGALAYLDPTGMSSNVELSIPAGSITQNLNMNLGRVNNPPALPAGLNFVGAPTDFGPDGTTFVTEKPATIIIGFKDGEMNQAGVESKAALKLYSYDKSKGVWSEEKIISIDTVNNIVVGEVKHFSFFALVGLSGTSPDDLGTPQPGDFLFCLASYLNGYVHGWYPGHVGIYTGEKKWERKGLASADVKRCGMYNVVEALWGGVQYSYYAIPNATRSCKVETKFEDDGVYMGAREPKKMELTAEQRIKLISYVENQVGKPYVQGQNYGVTFGLLAGYLVKGPDDFNCVGLLESGLEKANFDHGVGLIPTIDEYPALSPAQLYFVTKPAGGKDAGPVINWVKLSPDKGTSTTKVLAEVSVAHPWGLKSISKVSYMSDNGYINPNVEIKDDGKDGDKKAGDGIYSAEAMAGGNPANGKLGLTFVVTDSSGKSVSYRAVFTYNAAGPVFTQSVLKQFSNQ